MGSDAGDMKARKDGRKVLISFRARRRSNVSGASASIGAVVPPAVTGAVTAAAAACPPAEVDDSLRKNADERIRSTTPAAMSSELSRPRPRPEPALFVMFEPLDMDTPSLPLLRLLLPKNCRPDQGCPLGENP
jgi:hypothetical protein